MPPRLLRLSLHFLSARPAARLTRTTPHYPPRPIPTSTSSPRAYHAYDRPTPPPYPPTETAILTAALGRVPAHGFSKTALALGARDAGYLPVSTNLFPAGEMELVKFWCTKARLGLGGTVEKEGLPEGGVRGRVKELVRRRLRMNVEGGVVGRWGEAIALMAHPTYAPTALAELSRLADEILFLAGDASLDSAWYAKRAALAGVYAAAETFQTQDTSPGCVDTERFARERLGDVESLGKAFGDVGEWVEFTVHGVLNGLRSKGVRL
ncbi:ubiquinone biosynthesis protein COQ9, mitochondrial precursor [Trichodelitschia bisporula]|uniref:Ubiquinone biosynthesis protein n=1 Tax=Trichodelitschia bisporula TaxID=703511 RepID=A0A6G1I2E0_9PEZI|nr:ubiquinone biosynthesis protein COQ9, mitochondrial precursor [Trichodelitschia bisporula]